jgi:uncharacterized protein
VPSRFPLRVNIGFMLGLSYGQSREMNFSFEKIRLDDPADLENLDGLELDGLEGSARFSRTPQGILLQGLFKGRVNAQCVRCLADIEQLLTSDFSELYAFDERTLTDAGLLYPEDGNIDLAPLLREYMLLELPIRPLCRPDCKGLCPECGTDWNTTTCLHQSTDH